MQAILLIGIQATGKSTFFKERFADSHVRINRDMLRTRHRQAELLKSCIAIQQPFVADNTNATRVERATFIAPAAAAGFQVIGYYFASSIDQALARNAQREEAQRVPERGVRGTHARLELPSPDEGFDALYYVTFAADGSFDVQEWRDEI